MQIKRKVKSLIQLSGWGMLGTLAVIAICPVASETVQAADKPISAGDKTLSVSVSSGTVALETDPAVDSGMALNSVKVSVMTTNETGYTMKFNATDVALRSADSSNKGGVATISKSMPLTSFASNSWGYYFGDSVGGASTTYSPVPKTATDIDSTTEANSKSRTKFLTIAAKVGNTLPADTYSTELVVSVVGNAPKIPDLASISDMQQITSSVCSLTSEGYEKQLKDTRDGQLYYVGKMKDGRCWMLQNLALGDASGETTLTSANSNVTSNWSLPKSLTTVRSGNAANFNAIQSWNFGKWVLATPLLAASCGNSNIVSLAYCTMVGFVDVSSSSFQPTYTATTRSWDGANANSSTLVAVNCTTWSGSGTSKVCTAGTYDPHYLVGNYYSWNAATAGTGGSTTSGQASGSICPKGWKLPINGSSDDTMVVESFSGLLSQYGVSSELSGTINGTTYNIAGAPLRFVRGGRLYPAGELEYAGQGGYYWSSTPDSNPYSTYNTHFSNSNVYLFGKDERYVGFSVRCINDDSI